MHLPTGRAPLAVALLLAATLAGPAAAATQRIDLAPGFNFVGLTVTPDPAVTSAALLADGAVGQVFRFDPAGQSFQYQIKLAGGSLIGTAFALRPGEGNVVKATGAAALDFAGAPATESVTATLAAGFNLVCFGELLAEPVAKGLLTEAADVESIFRWDEGSASFKFCMRLPTGELFGNDFNLSAGQAYFIRAKAAGALVFGLPADPALAALAPTVTGVTPSSVATKDLGTAAGRFTVTGTNFGTDGAKCAVKLGGLTIPAAQVTLADTELSFGLTDAQAATLLSADLPVVVERTVTGSTGDPATLRATAATRVRIEQTTLQSIAVTAAAESVATGGTLAFTATGTWGDGSSGDLTARVSWSVASGGGSIDAAGLFTAPAAEGSPVIRASYLLADVSGTKTILVVAPVLTGEMIIPEVLVAGGGIQGAPSGSVYYHNAAHTAAESDVRMDATVGMDQGVRRYLAVAGTAVPDDSGYTDRFYHAVNFTVQYGDGSTDRYTLPVDANDRFTGYLYFTRTGACNVFSFRANDETLYPRAPSRGTAVAVDENQSTLWFRVNVAEAVPAEVAHLLPTRNVDCGDAELRAYAGRIVAGASTEVEKARALFEFLVRGDARGPFTYLTYDKIYPDYLSSSWDSVFLASHMLARRQGVCNDFGELYAALARSLGFKVMKRSGDAYDGGHLWNVIWLEGRWQRLDATWGNNWWDPDAPGNLAYRKWAEFYPEFNAAEFDAEHDGKYTANLKSEY